jgi:hypothetical protein
VSEFNFQEADKQIRAAWHVETGRNRRSMVIGWLGYQCKRLGEYEKNGYRDEADYRDKVGVSRSVWGRVVRIASFFEDLDLASFVLMTAANAELLASLPREQRYSADWLERAVRLKEEDFRREIIREKACAAGIPVPEMRVTYKLKMFEAQRTIIINALNEFRREHQIADEGTALEWLVLEYSARKTFVGFITQQLAVLNRERWNGDPQEVLAVHITALAELLANLKGESIEAT